MSLDDAARYRGASDAAGGSREASAHERRWAASFAAGYAVLWMVSPGYPTAGIVTFVLSLGLQRALFPALGHELLLVENLLVSTVFTTASLLRGYAIRRLFNALREDLP